MTLSRAEIELILPEVEPIAGRGVLQRVLELDPQTRVLQLREPGNTHYLCLCTQPQVTRIHFIQNRSTQPPSPTAFTMQLRRWLQGALFERVTQLQKDRIVRLDFRAVDPDWEPEEEELAAEDSPQRAPRVAVALVVELTGRHPNWYLLDAKDSIIGQASRESLGARTLRPGVVYQPPAAPSNPEQGASVRWGLEALDPAQFERSAKVEAHYGTQVSAQNFEELHRALSARLRKRLKRLKRRVGHIEGDLERAESSDAFRRRGELLQAAWGKVERGDKSVQVQDFYDPAMPMVEVPLDPALSLEKNIEYNFHEYRRLKDARAQIEERLLGSMELCDAAAAALQKLEALTKSFGEPDDPRTLANLPPDARNAAMRAQSAQEKEQLETLERFEKELISAGTLKPQRKRQPQSGRDKPARLPYRKFRSYHDHTILVGRGAADNDTLTTSVARGRDMWFHARDWPGSHVVLRMDQRKEELKNEDLLDAATLAAWFSRGKNDTLIDVTYTRAKYVRKPKGFPPGRVTVADGATIGLSLEKSRLKRLMDSEE